MKIKHGFAAAAALAFLLLAGGQVFAASPGRVSYQGTLRKNGVLFSGTAAMEFRITNADGSVVYWASGSTDVVVSTGLFRYALGSPNETDFGNIVWKEISPYVQMNLDGGWLPREPLYTSVYSLHSRTAESSTGTFTINGGDLRLTAAAGTKGIYFQDGTAQYSAPGWAVTGSYTSFAGGAGVGTLTPATRLDVQAAGGDTYVQFWRNSAGIIKATMTAAGLLYADGSQLSNLPAGADNMGNHTATTTLLMANFPISNAGAITANGQLTTYSSATVVSPFGTGSPKLKLASGVEVSSYSAGGVYISSNVTLAAGGKYFGDGSMLGGVNDSLGGHIATRTLDMAGYWITGVSTINVTAALSFDPNVAISSAAGLYSGIFISTNVNLAPGARYYGDGTGLTGIVGTDNLGNHTLTQNLVTGSNWLSYNGSASGLSLDAAGNVGIGQAAGSARLDVRGSGGDIQLWRNGATIVASMTASGLLYADGSQLRNLPAGGTANKALNMASFDIANVSTVTLSSITSSGAGVVFSTNVLLMSGRLGINTILPQDSLDVNGGLRSSSLSGSGNQCVYADNAGRLLLSGSGLCGNATGNDNLGNRIMLGNLITGSNWISFDGSNGGLSVNISSNVGIGVLSAATRLDVQARSGDVYAQIWRDSAGVIQASMTAAGILYADASRMINLPAGGDSFGGHTATQAVNMAGNQILNVSSITVAGALGVGAAVRFDNNIEISSSTGLNRGVSISTNVYIVGIASAVKYYGDGSGLTGVISSPDGMGNHIATLDLNMSGKAVVGVSTITLSSVTSSGAGVVFSTNILLMNGRLGVNTALPQESLDVNGNFRSSSLSGAGNQCVYADNTGRLLLSGSGLCGNATGNDNLGNRIMLGNLITGSNWISFDGSNGGLSVNVSSDVGIGVLSAATRLDVQARSGDVYAQIWRNSAGVIQASMSAAGLLFADASQMRNLPSGADNLGNHTASQNLDMSSKEILSVSTITAGYLSSPGAGVIFTTNALVLNGGRLGINTSLPQASLDVNGSMISSSLAGSGARCVHVNNSGQLQLAGSDCGTIAGNDNLGDHTMTTNLVTANHWINGDFDDEGLRVDPAGNVSIGTSTAYGRLDVKGSVGNYIQVWRDFSDVMQASMSATGVLYADGSKLRNLPDGLGNHIATTTLNMAGSQILNVSSLTVAGAAGAGAARLRLSSGVEISSETSAASGGGVRISSNVYIVGYSSAAKYYGDGSALTGVSGSDGLGNHLATQNLDLNTFNLVNVASITARGAVTSYSSVTIAGDLGVGAALRFYNNVEISSYTGLNRGIYVSTNIYIVGIASATKYYGDGSALYGVAGGNVVDTLSATLGAGSDAGGLNISNAGNINAASVGVGTTPATAALEVNDADANTLTSGLKFTNFSCTGTDKLAVGADGKVVCQPDAVGGGTGNLVDNLYDTLGMGDDAGGRAIQNAGSITGSSLTATGALGLLSARVKLNSAVEISSDTSGAFAGLRVSSNVYMVGFSSAAKYYGDGSALTGIAGADNLGSHLATQDLNLNTHNLLNVAFITAQAVSSVAVIGVLDVYGSGYTQIWRNAVGVAVASMTDAGVLYADGSKLRNMAGGGSLSSILAAGGNAGAGYMVNVSSLAIGRTDAGAALDVHAHIGQASVQLWRGYNDLPFATMTVTGSGGEFHSAYSFLRSVEISSQLAVGNNAGIDPGALAVVSGIFDDVGIQNFNIGIGAISLVQPLTNKTGAETAVGGNFRGGIVPDAGVTANFPTLIGIRTAAWANTTGQVTNAYGIWVQNEQTAGTVVNNYGIDIKTPIKTGVMTNNYGLYVRDQSGLGTTTDFNIYSAGAASKNRFEGNVQVDGELQMRLPPKAKAAFPTLDPVAAGELYYCSDCITTKLVVSTGTAVGSFTDAVGAAIN